MRLKFFIPLAAFVVLAVSLGVGLLTLKPREIPSALTASDRDKAKGIAEIYIDIFGTDRFFIELQSHIPEQAAVNPELIDLADRVGAGELGHPTLHGP